MTDFKQALGALPSVSEALGNVGCVCAKNQSLDVECCCGDLGFVWGMWKVTEPWVCGWRAGDADMVNTCKQMKGCHTQKNSGASGEAANETTRAKVARRQILS